VNFLTNFFRLLKILWPGSKNNPLDFSGDLDHDLDPGFLNPDHDRDSGFFKTLFTIAMFTDSHKQNMTILDGGVCSIECHLVLSIYLSQSFTLLVQSSVA